MSMQIRSKESRAVFEQLRAQSQPGVKCVIENHDAWVNCDDVQRQVDVATRERIARAPRMAGVAERIGEQRRALQSLVTVLPARTRSAG